MPARITMCSRKVKWKLKENPKNKLNFEKKLKQWLPSKGCGKCLFCLKIQVLCECSAETKVWFDLSVHKF